MVAVRRLFSSKPLKGTGTIVRIDARESHHARDVLRLREGDGLLVFDEDGRQFAATVKGQEERCLVVVLGEPAAAAPETAVPVSLYIALAKTAAFESVLQKAVELGVSEIAPFVSERCVVHLESGGTMERKMDRWRQIVLGATKQCGRARQAIVVPPCSLQEALSRPGKSAICFCCSEVRNTPRMSEVIASHDCATANSLAVMIGPEGGLTEAETALAGENGWRLVSLGPRTLRVETAAVSALTLLLSSLAEI